MKTIVVHNGIFHPDDVCAAATLQLLLESQGGTGTFIRTRDEAVIETADFVCDVGGIFDPAKNRFDHHQLGGAGARANGIQYASFGLVWKTYGLSLCGNNQGVADFIELKLVAGIDATDNGQAVTENKYEDVKSYGFVDIIFSLLPTWQEESAEEVLLQKFNEAVLLARNVITREIKKATDIVNGELEVEKIYNKTEDKRLIVLNKYLPWKKKIESFPEPLITVFPNTTGGWVVYCVPEDISAFTSRIKLPETWAGKNDDELASITGVADAVFCHRARFMAAAKSQKGAVALAKQALLM
ncbi:MAG: MYG1 family protein [bacterium]